MADTFHATTSLLPLSELYQLPPNPTLMGEEGVTTAALLPTLGGNPGLPVVEGVSPFAVFNTPGSGCVVNILDIELIETQGRTTTGTNFQFDFARCSALTGGDDVDVIQLDSNATPLPSQVLVREVVGGYTPVGATLRRMLDLPQLNSTRAMPYPVWRGAAASGTNDRLYGASNTDVQGQILREGEGTVILTTAGTGKEPFPLAVCVLFSVGTDTFMARSRGSADTFPAFIGIFNGSGSGVVITVNQVWVAELATNETTLRRYQLETISGLRTIDPVECVPMDSTNAPLPSGVVVSRKASCLQISEDSCVPNTRRNEDLLRRLVRPDAGASPGLATPFFNPPTMGKTIFGQNSASPMVLREGEGIALFQRQTNSGWCFGYQASVTFSVELTSGQQISPVIGSTLIRGML